jgi:hypothetical protein
MKLPIAEWEVLQLLKYPDTEGYQRSLLVAYLEEKLVRPGRPRGTTKESKLDTDVAGFLASIGRTALKGPKRGRDAPRLSSLQMKSLIQLAIEETGSSFALTPSAVHRAMDRAVNRSVKNYVLETMRDAFYRMSILDAVYPTVRYKKDRK